MGRAQGGDRWKQTQSAAGPGSSSPSAHTLLSDELSAQLSPPWGCPRSPPPARRRCGTPCVEAARGGRRRQVSMQMQAGKCSASPRTCSCTAFTCLLLPWGESVACTAAARAGSIAASGRRWAAASGTLHAGAAGRAQTPPRTGRAWREEGRGGDRGAAVKEEEQGETAAVASVASAGGAERLVPPHLAVRIALAAASPPGPPPMMATSSCEGV